MRLLGVLAWAWLAGALLARAAEGALLLWQVGGALLAVLGLTLLLRGAPRLGLTLATAAVASLVTPPVPSGAPAIFDGRIRELVARVEGTPRLGEERSQLVLALERARFDEAYAQSSARLRLVAPARLREPLGPGDRVLLQGRVGRLDRSCNPGACDGGWRAAAQALDGGVRVHRSDHVLRLDEPARGIEPGLWAARQALRRAIEARLPAEEAALVAALVLGERGEIDRATEARFRAVGVTHLLSVSGLHLAFAAGLLFATLRRLLGWIAPDLGRRRPRDRWAALAAAPVVVAYAVLTGGEVATLRAALVVSYAFFALVLSRRLRARDALAFAALALLLPRPARAFDPSFQLSFVAALAAIYGGSTGSAAEADGGLRERLRRLGRGALQLLRVSLAATLATAPLTALWFSEIAPMGVASNLVAVPLSEVLLVPLGIVGASLDALAPALGTIPLHLSGFCAWLLLALVGALEPISPVWVVPEPSALCLLASAVALVHLARGPGLRRLLLSAALVAAVVLGERAAAWLWPSLEICFLDVGQGDAAVALASDGTAIVVDGGPDPEAYALLGHLRRRGVRRIALVVLSHAHPDHAGGLARVLEELPVDRIWTNGRDGPDPATQALLRAARARGVPVEAPAALRLGSIELQPLGPRGARGAFVADPVRSENDSSIAVALGYGGRRVLFVGDVESEGEAELVRAAPGRVDVLKVPHHASRTSSSADLLDAIAPGHAVASLAEGNRYRFPHPDVVSRYRARGVPLHRTDRDGAVTLRISSHGRLRFSCARPPGCVE